MKSAALYYLTSSVLATGAFFMLCEMIDRTRQFGEDMPLETMEPSGRSRLIPILQMKWSGIVIPAAMAFLGMGFSHAHCSWRDCRHYRVLSPNS